MRNLGLATALALILALPCAAQDAKPTAKPPTPNAASGSGEKSPEQPAFTPPQRGSPKGRIAATSRGDIDPSLPAVWVLAPEKAGLTVSASPALYWYVSSPAKVRIEVTLVDDKGEQPVIEYPVDMAQGPAVHRIDLSKHKVRLKRDVEYHWSIAVIRDPEHRSADLVAGGAVKRVAAPAGVAAKRAQIKDRAELARLYGAAGLWYDAIAIYSDLIEQRPDDKALRAQRAALLEQVGLKDVAAFDRR